MAGSALLCPAAGTQLRRLSGRPGRNHPRRSAGPREVPAGRYPVILEPPAVQGLVGPLTWNLGARGYNRDTTALAGKLDQQIIDPRPVPRCQNITKRH